MNDAAYDEIGLNYSDFPRTDPRIEARGWAALGDARSIVDVGAGTGSYEPRDRKVIAVEPSSLMIAKRGQERLRADLESGRRDERHGHLPTLPELDIGLRLVTTEL